MSENLPEYFQHCNSSAGIKAGKSKHKQKLTFCDDPIYLQVWAEMSAAYVAKEAEFSQAFSQLPLWKQTSQSELARQHQAWCDDYMDQVRAEVSYRKLIINQARDARRFVA